MHVAKVAAVMATVAAVVAVMATVAAVVAVVEEAVAMAATAAAARTDISGNESAGCMVGRWREH